MEIKPFSITAKSWAVCDINSNILMSSCPNAQLLVASLTKVMTFYVCHKLIESFALNVQKTNIIVTEDAAIIDGTSALLCEGDSLSLQNMLYALMLPSGNDAAVCLSSFFGEMLKSLIKPKSFLSAEKLFIKEMNTHAKKLNMARTTYSSVHGMDHLMNKSTCEDLAKLCSAAMKIDLFRRIVCTAKYQCTGKNILGDSTKYEWANTNRLLSHGYHGIKTGTTDMAGYCLISVKSIKERDILFITLNSASDHDRWHDTLQLTKWFEANYVGKAI